MCIDRRPGFAILVAHRVRLPLVLLQLVVLTGLLPAADLHVAAVFDDNAVLQQGVMLPVWGTAKPLEQVTVHFADQTQTTRAANDGSWRVKLAPLRANAEESTLLVESGAERRQIGHLLVGEVWYASGQSNMQMTLGACAKRIPEIQTIVESGSTNEIRWLRVDEPDSEQPLADRQTTTAWQIDTAANRANQSAVAYCFARRIYQELGVPIGVIEGSWGGKPIEGFIPRRQFEKHEKLQPILRLADQNELEELAQLHGGVIVRNSAGMPGRIFNARVSPIAPYAVRGFIWYQGESNAGRGEDPRNYRIKMRALVDGWRETWAQENLPFYFVQLPAYKNEATGWVRLREEQRLSLGIPHSGMAVTIDLRDTDIHPANKLDVGNRLASWALAATYRKPVPRSGPLFRSVSVEGDTIRVEFDHAESGLMVAHKEGLEAPQPTPEIALAHFELADESGAWYPAQAKIDASTVVVRSSEVSKPIAVRYACSGGPENANLYNRMGLPASPFCSDLKLLRWESEH